MSQPSKYLDYLYCDLGSPYSITQRDNWFYIGIWDAVIGAYYAKPIKSKSRVFNIF